MENDNPPELPKEDNCVVKNNQEADLNDVVDGKRMLNFRDLIDKMVKKCMTSARCKRFAVNLKPAYKKNPDNFKKIHNAVIEQVKHNIFEEMECMYKEEKIAQMFNKIDEICETQEDIEGWRPSGEPELDVEAHLTVCKIKQRDQLLEIVKNLESKNRLLQNALKPKQRKILETGDKIEEHYIKYKELSDVLDSNRLNALEDVFNKIK